MKTANYTAEMLIYLICTLSGPICVLIALNSFCQFQQILMKISRNPKSHQANTDLFILFLFQRIFTLENFSVRYDELAANEH